MIAFIDANRHRRTVDGLVWGVEPICAVCRIAPQTYHAAKKRPPSARAIRDAELMIEIQRVYDACADPLVVVHLLCESVAPRWGEGGPRHGQATAAHA